MTNTNTLTALAEAHNTNRFINIVAEDARLDGKLGITSNQIAEVTGKRHDNVLKDIKEKFGLLKFEESSGILDSTYTNKQNKTQPCKILDRQHASALLSFYDITFGLEVQEAFDIAMKAIAKPLTPEELLIQCVEVIEGLKQKNEALTHKIEADEPAVAFAKEITAVKTELTPSKAGKELGFKPNKFMERLREDGFLCQLRDKNGKKLARANEPYQRWIEQDLFTVGYSSYFDATKQKHIQTTQTYITVKGQAYFHEKYRYDKALKA